MENLTNRLGTLVKLAGREIVAGEDTDSEAAARLAFDRIESRLMAADQQWESDERLKRPTLIVIRAFFDPAYNDLIISAV